MTLPSESRSGASANPLLFWPSSPAIGGIRWRPMPQIRFPGESSEQRRARALRERVETLRDARQRIIAAADEERRRIERDLHDGAQQRMVAVCLTLGLVEQRIHSDPDGAAALV